MAITKEIVEDKIEIVGEHKSIQIRIATVIKEDGVELTRTFHRKTLECVSSSYDGSSWTTGPSLNRGVFANGGTGATNSKRGQIRYEQNNERMKFFTGGSEKLTILLKEKIQI